MDLDARAVELPLDRRRPGLLERRRPRPARSRPASARSAARPRAGTARGRRPPARPRRPPRGRRAASAPAGRPSPARPAAFATASPTTATSAPWRMSAEHERPQERLLGRGRARQQRDQRRPASRHRARAAHPRHRLQRRVDLGDGQRRVIGGRGRVLAQRRPAHAEHPLARASPRASSSPATRSSGVEPPQRGRDPLDLRQPAATRHGRPRWRRQARRTASSNSLATMAAVLVTGASCGIGRAAARGARAPRLARLRGRAAARSTTTA